MANDGELDSVDQPASIRIIADHYLLNIDPRHCVIDRTLDFDPQWP
jgi:hypothetical protein